MPGRQRERDTERAAGRMRARRRPAEWDAAAEPDAVSQPVLERVGRASAALFTRTATSRAEAIDPVRTTPGPRAAGARAAVARTPLDLDDTSPPPPPVVPPWLDLASIPRAHAGAAVALKQTPSAALPPAYAAPAEGGDDPVQTPLAAPRATQSGGARDEASSESRARQMEGLDEEIQAMRAALRLQEERAAQRLEAAEGLREAALRETKGAGSAEQLNAQLEVIAKSVAALEAVMVPEAGSKTASGSRCERVRARVRTFLRTRVR